MILLYVNLPENELDHITDQEVLSFVCVVLRKVTALLEPDREFFIYNKILYK